MHVGSSTRRPSVRSAALGLAGGMVLALALGCTDSDDPPRGLSPGVWVVLAEPRGELTPDTNLAEVVFDVRVIGESSERFVAEAAGPAVPAFSPDGGRIAIVAMDATLHMVDTATGDTWEESDTGIRPFAQPLWSPGGAHFLASSGELGTSGAGLTFFTRAGEVHSSVKSDELEQGIEPVLRNPHLGIRATRSRWIDDQRFGVWFVEYDETGPGVQDWTRGYVATATLGAPGELSWEFAVGDATWVLEVFEQEFHPQPPWVFDSGEYPGAMNAGHVNVIREDVRAALIRYRDDGALPILPIHRDSPDNKYTIVAEVDGELLEFHLEPDLSWSSGGSVWPAPAWDIVVIR